MYFIIVMYDLLVVNCFIVISMGCVSNSSTFFLYKHCRHSLVANMYQSRNSQIVGRLQNVGDHVRVCGHERSIPLWIGDLLFGFLVVLMRVTPCQHLGQSAGLNLGYWHNDRSAFRGAEVFQVLPNGGGHLCRPDFRLQNSSIRRTQFDLWWNEAITTQICN